MSTAHRPTWNPARGGAIQGGFQTIAPSARQSSRDVAARHLKIRKGQQIPVAKTKEELKKELFEKERRHFLQLQKGAEWLEKATNEQEASKERTKIEDEGNDDDDNDDDADAPLAGDEIDNIQESHGIKDEIDEDKNLSHRNHLNLTEEKADSHGDVADSDDDDSDDDDSDDDEEEDLMRELARIKKERQEEQLRKEQEQQAFEERQRTASILQSNPLLNIRSKENGNRSFSVKRRWDDDVIFRNQAQEEKKPQRQFINDTIRNDFHKRFLDKYMH